MIVARMVGTTGMVVALLLALNAGAAAQTKPARATPVPLPATGQPPPAGGAIGSLDVVTAGMIAATAAPDIRAALALVPTLVIEDAAGRSGQVTISLRGSNSRQVLVLVDGHRVSAAPSSAFNLNDLAVPVERIARIEVLPAPVSALYGPDALGGVVNIVTLPAAATPALGVSYGRGAEADQRIAGGVQYGLKKLGLRLDGQLFTGDGFRENGDFDQKSFTVGMAVAPAPWGLDVRWTSLEREAGAPGPSAQPANEARRRDAHDGLRADVVYLPGGGWDFKAGVFTRSQSLRLTDPAPPVIDPLVPSAPVAGRRENSSSGFEAQLNIDTKGTEFYTVGAEWVSDSFKSDGGEDRTAERWSVYTQDQWRTGGWSAVGALRRDQHSRYGGWTNPSLSVGWGGGAGWQLWAAWARNFRAPSFDELYQDEQFVKGNPDLKAETSESYDGGIAIGGAGGRVRVGTFRRSIDNLISWTDADGDLVSRPVNVSRATLSGWEAELLYRPSAAIAIPVGYQRFSTRDDETDESIPGAVRSLWRAAIQGTGAKLTWSLEYTATNRGDGGQGDGVVNHTVINAAVAWRDIVFSVPVQVSLRAENLQDRADETAEGYPMRGRSWFAQVKLGL